MAAVPCVILTDFSPEEPALSEVEVIWRASARVLAGGICARREMLRKLSMTPG